MKKIFLYLDEDWRNDDSAASFFLTDQLGIEFDSDEVFILTDNDIQRYSVPFGAGIEAYTFIFTDENLKLSFKGVSKELREFKSAINGKACYVSGLWNEPNAVLRYVVKSSEELNDHEQLLSICLNDVSDAESQYAYIGAVEIDHAEMKFHSALAEEYLGYLDVLVNYSEFRSKMTKVFDYVFTKVNEFYLKLVTLKASIMSQFHDLRKVQSENPRAALIVQSIYSGMNFDENTVAGDFELIDNKYESIQTFTKSINESRQARVGESLNTIMFWVAVISFFFGIISFYDKYQSSQTFNLAALEAFTMTGFILLPFAILFMFIFMRNGVMFEGIARVLKLFMVKLKTSRSYIALRWSIGYKAHVVDPEWASTMEYLTTELVNGLLPQKTIAEDEDLEGRSDAEETVYFTRIKPRIRLTYHNLIKQLHWKTNRLFDEKFSIKIRNRKQQFELIVSEICLFTTLNNWYLESNDIEKDSELHFIDAVIMHSIYASWIKYFESDTDLITGVAHTLECFDDLKVQSLTAEYLMTDTKDENEELSSLFQSLCKDADHEHKEDIPGMVLNTLVEMDSPYWDADAIPVYLPDTYLELGDSEDEESCSQISMVTNQANPLVRDALWTLHVENYLKTMEKELATTECE